MAVQQNKPTRSKRGMRRSTAVARLSLSNHAILAGFPVAGHGGRVRPWKLG